MDKIKEFFGKMTAKTKIMIGAGAVALVAAAVLIVNSLNNKPYEVLFTGLSSTEAQQIIGKLQEEGTPYQYRNTDISVPEDTVDVTRAKLVTEGYPKSGFTYDVFRTNVGMMTTDSDRKTFMLYDLQTRIGSTIQLFKGVRDAYVTIALGDNSRFALEDNITEPSAQAVVVMEDGGSPGADVAKSIQLLISRSIPGMVINNVSVFDGNGREVSVTTGDEGLETAQQSGEITQLIEDQIAAKIMNVLGAAYGNGNVRIAVKAKVNMEKLLRESISYSTPEKAGEDDKKGIVSEESLTSEYSGSGQVASGVAGAESNADIPQYNTQANEEDNAYGANNVNRQYLVNQIKEQGSVSPGALEDLTVSVVINDLKAEGDDGQTVQRLGTNDLQRLIGNAAGIAPEDRERCIAVAYTPFFTVDVPKPVIDVGGGGDGEFKPIYLIIAASVFGVLLILLITLVILRKRKKKRAGQTVNMAIPLPVRRREQEPKKSEDELLEFNNEKGMELQKNVRDFADQNPEISAQLLKSWLNGGGSNG